MRANVLTALSLASLAFASSAFSDGRTGSPMLPVSSAHGSVSRWKSLPEDTSSWRREPFRKQARESKGGSSSPHQVIGDPSPEINLQGILKSNRSYYAIINGRTVRPGDRIDGWTISGITRHSVTVRRDKQIQVFDIFQGRIDRGSR